MLVVVWWRLDDVLDDILDRRAREGAWWEVVMVDILEFVRSSFVE